MQEIIKILEDSKQQFGNMAETTKLTSSCAICMEDFIDEGIVNELNCNGKHIFHFDCLETWFKSREDEIAQEDNSSCLFKCPTCRTPV